ncbi:hypothetical protein HDU96_007619 [Phlyctochytrium bullatum]|nr:hypothetical protein HDU96_007619 [Phlyctochytrium bullatum]
MTALNIRKRCPPIIPTSTTTTNLNFHEFPPLLTTASPKAPINCPKDEGRTWALAAGSGKAAQQLSSTKKRSGPVRIHIAPSTIRKESLVNTYRPEKNLPTSSTQIKITNNANGKGKKIPQV